MGMMFNTSETKNILRKLNIAFSGNGLSNLRTMPPPGFSVTNLGAAYGRSIFDYVCVPLHISSGHPKRWEFWCRLLDTTLDDSGLYYLSYLIGNALGDAINNAQFEAVEFFAVLATSVPLSVDISDLQDPHNAALYAKIITVSTELVDAFPRAPHPNT